MFPYLLLELLLKSFFDEFLLDFPLYLGSLKISGFQEEKDTLFDPFWFHALAFELQLLQLSFFLAAIFFFLIIVSGLLQVQTS